jgi:membrane fusion protein (multidrug efflux system)
MTRRNDTMIRTTPLALLVGSALTLTLSACSDGASPGAIPRAETPLNVSVSATVQAGGTERHVASLEADQVAALATRTSGVIRRLPVDVGSRVRAGDLLVELDASDVQARVSAARAQAELARAGARRVENLARDGAASPHELDQARAGLAAAEAALADAEAQLTYVTIRAPFDGLVTERHASAGDLAGPGHPILVLVAPGTRKVVAELPARAQGQVQVGSQLALVVDGIEGRAQMRVTRVVPALGAQGRTFRIEGTLEGVSADAMTQVIPGTHARVELPADGDARRWIPADALVERGQLTGVFTVEGGRARLRWIRVGQRQGDGIEVLAGPTAGAFEVIRRPSTELFDGRPVTASGLELWTPAHRSTPEVTP